MRGCFFTVLITAVSLTSMSAASTVEHGASAWGDPTPNRGAARAPRPPGVAEEKTYVEPNGAFAVSLPEGWTAERVPLESNVWLVECGAGKDLGPRIDVSVVEVGQGGIGLDDLSKIFIDAVIAELGDAGTVLSDKRSKSTFANQPAVQSDLKFRDDEGNVFEGYMVCVLGKRFFIGALGYWPQTDASAKAEVARSMGSLALESRTPLKVGGAGGDAGGSMLTRDALQAAAARVKGGFQREAAATVLAEGDPPLTLDAVVSFVELLRFVFQVELTETEFDMTKARFVEYYRKNDADGRAVLVGSGKSILGGLQSGSPEERSRNLAEVKQVMESRLSAGAKAGIEWAVVLWDAIQRRSTSLKEVSAKKPEFAEKNNLDTDFSQGDLDAALEMLYFMWVASGRDPNLVTPEAVSHVRTLLVTNFERFDPQLQYVLANAQRVYSGMRGQYAQANAAERAALAQEYGATLDWLGLGVPRAGGGGGDAWADVAGTDSGTLKAQLVQNGAFLATNSWQR